MLGRYARNVKGDPSCTDPSEMIVKKEIGKGKLKEEVAREQRNSIHQQQKYIKNCDVFIQRGDGAVVNTQSNPKTPMKPEL